jgi:hemerythrin superfamily protein
MMIMNDLMNLTEQTVEEWRLRYYKSTTDHDLTEETIRSLVPLSPEAYDAKYNRDQEELDSLKTAAGVDVDTVAPKNDFTESLRIAAGIK